MPGRYYRWRTGSTGSIFFLTGSAGPSSALVPLINVECSVHTELKHDFTGSRPELGPVLPASSAVGWPAVLPRCAFLSQLLARTLEEHLTGSTGRPPVLPVVLEKGENGQNSGAL